MAIYCTNCGKEIAEGVAFCTECGTKAPEAVTEPKTEAAAEVTLCKKCGTALPEGVGFCTECGTPRNGEPAAEAPKAAVTPPPPKPTYTPPAQSYVPPTQTYTPPVQNTAPVAAAPDPKTKVVGTGTFFGLQLLFAIPVIGWLACLIMAFAPKNKNIKHYARAMLIWLIIGLVVAVALFFLFKWVGGVLTDYINEATDGAFGGFGDIFEQFGEIKDQLPGGFENLPID